MDEQDEPIPSFGVQRFAYPTATAIGSVRDQPDKVLLIHRYKVSQCDPEIFELRLVLDVHEARVVLRNLLKEVDRLYAES